MTTPRLDTIPSDTATTLHFRVSRSGACGGRLFHLGADLEVATRTPVDGEPVVLVPRGPGRPRLGTVRKGRLYGAAGEPCAPAWWTVAGPVRSIPSGEASGARGPLLLPLPLAA